jgi:hypothetical protein
LKFRFSLCASMDAFRLPSSPPPRRDDLSDHIF